MAPGTIGNSENSLKIRSHAMVEEVNSRGARKANQAKTCKLIRLRHEVYGPALIVTITF